MIIEKISKDMETAEFRNVLEGEVFKYGGGYYIKSSTVDGDISYGVNLTDGIAEDFSPTTVVLIPEKTKLVIQD